VLRRCKACFENIGKCVGKEANVPGKLYRFGMILVKRFHSDENDDESYKTGKATSSPCLTKGTWNYTTISHSQEILVYKN